MPLDVLVSGGRIATLAGERGFGWVEAVGITAGRVAFAGSAIELETRADPHTLRIEMDPDEVAIPGLTDAHLHLAEGGLALDRIDLTSSPDARRRPRAGSRHAHAALADPDAWLEGHGWHNDRWGVWPTAADLERVAPGRQVALWAHDHHALWVSPRALRDRRDRRRSRRPGRRDHPPRPTPARRPASSTKPRPALVTDHVPPASARAVRALDRAAGARPRRARGRRRPRSGRPLAPGGTRPGDRRLSGARRAGRPPDPGPCLDPVRAARGRGRRELRSGDPLGPPGGRARFGWLKLFADGTLASRTAALLEPIEPEDGRPLPAGTERGIWLTPPEVLARLRPPGGGGRDRDPGPRDRRPGLPGRARRARRRPPGRPALMPRLEHVQLLHPDDRAAVRRGRDRGVDPAGPRPGRCADRARCCGATGRRRAATRCAR